MGVRWNGGGIMQRCFDWWKGGVARENRLIKFLRDMLPIVIMWELWTQYTSCKYGKGKKSVANVIFKVGKGMAECIHRRWPQWDALPPNWTVIMKKARGFGCQRITVAVCWEKPPRGYVKINCAANMRGDTCGYFVRNSGGQLCAAGVYSRGELFDLTLQELIAVMLKDCWDWCALKGIDRVVIGSNDIECLSDEVLPQGWSGAGRRCKEKVNCVVECCRWGGGGNVSFLKGGGLPRSFTHLLALEGLPQFLFVPGHDHV
ncbi:uncharacterized protein LOC116019135 [Ipomoea triloba]|uniref:uncharacterized protein LOC116019135 n=1 Tax=Ipomoea triloba TaxID=35885 RepID=UPI00125DA934|nr:uncharacterized protein LOC116019135 [Ipomoea triloba]